MSILNSLDVRTAYLIAGLVSLLSAAAMVVLRRLHSPAQGAALTVAGGLAAGGLCLVLASERGLHSPVVVVWLGLLLGGASFVLVLEALRQLYGQTPHFRVVATVIAVLGGALALAPDHRSLLLIHFGFQALCSLTTLAVVLRSHDDQANAGRLALIALFIGFSMVAFMRWFDSFNTSDTALLSPTLRHGEVQGLAIILYTLSPILIMILMLAIMNARQVAELTVVASTDELTGLASRRFLLSNAAHWRQSVEQQNAACALLMIDVDHFKAINDRFGHETGDEVLRHIARTLNANLRSDAILSRYGGEEFCALVPIARPAEAEAAAQRLRTAIESQPYRSGLTQINITISIGVAMHENRQSLQEVLRVADARVYKAKDMGRNRVVAEDFNSDLAIA